MKTFLIIILSLLFSQFAKADKIGRVILVHGAFADGSSWNKVIPLLQAKGLEVIAVQNPLTSLGEDVATTKRAIDNQKGPVLLVGHSWGGTVITEVGNHPNVAGLVYIAAFAPNDKQSVAELQNPIKPQFSTDAAGFLSLPLDVVKRDFAQDLKASEQKIIAATQGPIAAKCFEEKISAAAWKNKPSWYVMASQDRMIDPELQKTFSKTLNATTSTVKSGHVPMLSHPKEVSKAILSAINHLNSKGQAPKSAALNE